MKRIGVIGGGAWGTALATVAARAGREVTLWARETDVVTAINERHENRRFLPGVALDPSIRATDNLSDAVHADLLLLVTPAQNLAATAAEMAQTAEHLPPGVVCAKGIERQTGALMSDAVRRVAPELPLAVLSGPTFAREVAMGLPAAVSLACEDAGLGAAVVDAIGGPAFRPYLTDDLIGVQIGGAVKNVIAIAAGISTGRGLGDNARAAIIARGFAELKRLAGAKGRERGDPRRPLGPRRSRADLHQRSIAQLHLRVRARPWRVAGHRSRCPRGGDRRRDERAGHRDVGGDSRGRDADCRRGARGASSGASVDDAIGGLLARPFKPEAGAGRGNRS